MNLILQVGGRIGGGAEGENHWCYAELRASSRLCLQPLPLSLLGGAARTLQGPPELCGAEQHFCTQQCCCCSPTLCS